MLFMTLGEVNNYYYYYSSIHRFNYFYKNLRKSMICEKRLYLNGLKSYFYSLHKRGKWPIFFRWIQTPGFSCFNAYEGSKSFYSAKTAQKSAIFDRFWILLDKKWIRKCLKLVAWPIFFLYSVPTQNVVLNRN